MVRAILTKKISTQGCEIREGVCPVHLGGKGLKAEGMTSTKTPSLLSEFEDYQRGTRGVS